GNDLRRTGNLGQGVQTRIGHRHIADIGLDGAEGIIGRLRRRRLGQRIEERGLADIGQSDDAAFESHYSSSFFCSGFLTGVFSGLGGAVSSATFDMKPVSSSRASSGASSTIAPTRGRSQSISSLEK